MRESPEVKLAEQAVARGEAVLTQARKAPIPDLLVTGILVQSYEPLDTTGRPTGLQGGAQIGVQLPIFNRNQGNIAAAKGGIESARQELTRVKLQLQRDLAGMFRDYDWRGSWSSSTKRKCCRGPNKLTVCTRRGTVKWPAPIRKC